MPVPDDLQIAVAELSARSGHAFQTSDQPVPGTTLYVVYCLDHPMPLKTTHGTLVPLPVAMLRARAVMAPLLRSLRSDRASP